MKNWLPQIMITLAACLTAVTAQANDAEELARKAQDPLANISAIQLDMASKFNIGPDNDTAYSALVQPVYAISTEKINYIPRAVIPVLGVPNTAPGNDDLTWGIGDVIFQTFISPKTESSWKWGVGPQISFETRTDDALAGPGLGGGLVGVLVGGWGNLASSTIINHIWGADGDFSTTGVQPMLFYNFESVPGLALSYQGVISYDWKADDSDDRLTVPLGLQIGKMIDLGGGWGIEPALGAYGFPIRPDGAADWQVKASIFFIIP